MENEWFAQDHKPGAQGSNSLPTCQPSISLYVTGTIFPRSILVAQVKPWPVCGFEAQQLKEKGADDTGIMVIWHQMDIMSVRFYVLFARLSVYLVLASVLYQLAKVHVLCSIGIL